MATARAGPRARITSAHADYAAADHCTDGEDRRFSILTESCYPDQVAFRWAERRASAYSARDAFCRRGNSGYIRG